MSAILVSYGSEDSSRLERLVEELSSRGVSVRWEPHPREPARFEGTPGSEAQAISPASAELSGLVVVVPPHLEESSPLRQELEDRLSKASAAGLPIIPICLEPLGETRLPSMLETSTVMDLSTDLENGVLAIHEALQTSQKDSRRRRSLATARLLLPYVLSLGFAVSGGFVTASVQDIDPVASLQAVVAAFFGLSGILAAVVFLRRRSRSDALDGVCRDLLDAYRSALDASPVNPSLGARNAR